MGLIGFVVVFRESLLFRHTLPELIQRYPDVLAKLSFCVCAIALGAALLASRAYAISACRYVSLGGVVVSLGFAANATVVLLFFDPAVTQQTYFTSRLAAHSLLLWLLTASAFYRSFRLCIPNGALNRTT